MDFLQVEKVPSTLLTQWSYLKNVKIDPSVISHQTENILHLRVLVSQTQPTLILHLFQFDNTRNQMSMTHPSKQPR